MREFSIEPTDDGVLVTVPSAHRPSHLLIGVPLVAYLFLMLPMATVWASAYAEVVRLLGPVFGVPAGALVFVAGLALTYGPGLAGAFLIAFEYRCVERLRLDGRRLRVSYAVRRLAWPRRYRLDRIRDPRVVPAGTNGSWWAPARGGVSFSHRDLPQTIGAALTDDQARRVLELLEERLPQTEPEEAAESGSPAAAGPAV